MTDPASGAERPNHVWSYDFLEERTHDGPKLRLLNIIDEFTHECLAIRVSRRLKSIDVIDVLSDLFILRGIPEHIRSDSVLGSGPINRIHAAHFLIQGPPMGDLQWIEIISGWT